MKNAPAVADQSAPLQCACPAPANHKPPLVTGQAADVLAILLEHCPMLAIELPAMGVPQYQARIHDLRTKGCNIISTFERDVLYQGRTYARVARLSLGSPLWIEPEKARAHTPDLFEEGDTDGR